MDMAYVSLISLAQILDQIFCHTENNLLYNKQKIKSLREKVGFLQEFIEDCDQQRIKMPQDLENQMKNVAQLAEDVIETKMVDDILGRSPRHSEGSTVFSRKIEKLIRHFDSVKKMVMRMKEGEGVKDDQRSRKTYGTSSSGLPLCGKIGAVVGFKEHLIQVMDELTGQQPKRQIFPIVGMGGIGKTTLCRNVFENPLIVQHFHVRAWVTVSQEYSVLEIIRSLLREIRVPFEKEYQENTQTSNNEGSDDQLGELLYKGLSGRKYLIVMDDVWSIEVWDEVKMFLPDNGNGSRIMVTTRLLEVAHRLGSSSPYIMDFLDEIKSWSLLCQIVFGQESYPIELEAIGKQIARNCKGLPLAIVVVGGLLSKSDMTEEYWEYVAHHLSSIVNSENDERCLNILYLSYKHLPVHLKPCFLYMGIVPEDREIRVSKLIKLWVAEGFLKPIVAKSLEEVAEDYLKDLMDRNLVLIRTGKSSTKMKYCGIHDLLRDLCLKVAHKENFLWTITGRDSGINSLGEQIDLEEAPRKTNIFTKITRRISNFFHVNDADCPGASPYVINPWMQTPYSLNSPSSIKDARRLVIRENGFDNSPGQIYETAKSASLTRSLFSDSFRLTSHLLFCFRLLRIVDDVENYFPETIQEVVNSRYLAFRIRRSEKGIPPSIKLLWNLQTIVIDILEDYGDEPIALPSEIWEMPHLRHIEIKDAILPDPPLARVPNTDTRSHYLHNLQTLSIIRNFSCNNKNVLERIPNLKKLKITYRHFTLRYDDDLNDLNNLVHLQKLESLSCVGNVSLGKQAFPDSIKKLTLKWSKLPWEDMNKIGLLPNLEVLKLDGAFDGEEWNTVEGEFLKLKFLLLRNLNMCHWEAENSHFPRLEILIIRLCDNLEEIPFGIGEIPTLKLIELGWCGEKAKASAEQIREEQRSLGNEDLQVRVEWCL